MYLHVPKTSGISVADAFVQAVKPSRTYFGFDCAFFGDFVDFESVAPANRAFIHHAPAALPPHERVVRAHMAATTLRVAYPEGQLVTVLREPACRLLSHFMFWRGFSDAALDEWGGWGERMAVAREPWAAFLTDPRVACQTDNIVTRLLLWPHALIPDGDFIAPANDGRLLRDARRVLARFAYVGVAEDPDFWAHLEQWLDEPFQVHRFNETPAPAGPRLALETEFTSAAFVALAARTRLDRVLWEAALRAAAPAIDIGEAARAAQWRTVARFAVLA